MTSCPSKAAPTRTYSQGEGSEAVACQDQRGATSPSDVLLLMRNQHSTVLTPFQEHGGHHGWERPCLVT